VSGCLIYIKWIAFKRSYHFGPSEGHGGAPSSPSEYALFLSSNNRDGGGGGRMRRHNAQHKGNRTLYAMKIVFFLFLKRGSDDQVMAVRRCATVILRFLFF
jgi:hypothetical protein